ncbi:Calcium calmodulin-dependent protein kinase kinase 2 [Mortierella polycephala]|uniref:Calcium calmodulin-dependent protein kinase kinase 2 n=1 Tax=Mortierella polycephala TaxID=41804 RepID=A0A9P6PWV5_9FUNG|nr:Calcium calmodulin-dependent protein kinase kinase 2 [Mortierella polycephala]
MIPRDFYRKCTEDDHRTLSRSSGTFNTRSTRGCHGSVRKLRESPQDQRQYTAGFPTQRDLAQSTTTHTPKNGSIRPTMADLMASIKPTASMSFPSSPSLTSSLSSYPSTSSESTVSTSRLPSIGNPIKIKTSRSNNAVTICDSIATIHLRLLAMVPPTKRKLSQALEPQPDRNSMSKKPKADPCLISPSYTSISRVKMPMQTKAHNKTHDVVIISSDNEDDVVMECGVASSKIAVPITSSASAPTSASVSKTGHKYEIDASLRNTVETIFPSYEDHHKATLERAFATSRILRDGYAVTHYLGSGASGFVLAAKRVMDGKEVAIKVIPHTSEHVETKVQRELGILLKLKEQENILGILHHFTSSLYGDIDPDDQSNKDISFIVTEKAGLSLFDFIELLKPVQDESPSTRFKDIKSFLQTTTESTSIYHSGMHPETLQSLFGQLAHALHSMHAKHIVHGDVKDENALISMDQIPNTYRAMLCDFGHSKQLVHNNPPCFSFYGTTILAPPEMDKNIAARAQQQSNKGKEINANQRRAAGSQTAPVFELFSGYEADVWALGLTLYTMIHGDLPKEMFEKDPKLLSAYKRKRASRRMFPFTLQDNLEPELKDLLKSMLAVDPGRRITMSEVIKHPWVM